MACAQFVTDLSARPTDVGKMRAMKQPRRATGAADTHGRRRLRLLGSHRRGVGGGRLGIRTGGDIDARRSSADGHRHALDDGLFFSANDVEPLGGRRHRFTILDSGALETADRQSAPDVPERMTPMG